MKINLYATFRLLAGEKSFELDLPSGILLKDALPCIVDRCPALRTHWLDAAGTLYPHVHIFVNGHEAFTLTDGLDTALQPADTLDFFPPVAGGTGI